jgi:hypothetical protein
LVFVDFRPGHVSINVIGDSREGAGERKRAHVERKRSRKCPNGELLFNLDVPLPDPPIPGARLSETASSNGEKAVDKIVVLHYYRET